MALLILVTSPAGEHGGGDEAVEAGEAERGAGGEDGAQPGQWERVTEVT